MPLRYHRQLERDGGGGEGGWQLGVNLELTDPIILVPRPQLDHLGNGGPVLLFVRRRVVCLSGQQTGPRRAFRPQDGVCLASARSL
jgi:hypothetical protein